MGKWEETYPTTGALRKALKNVVIALSHHSPRCWKRRWHEQGVGKADGARIGD